MSMADHVRTLGRGPGRARGLTQDEAADAMRLMLHGDAAQEAVGAVLMLLRMKGETAEEIAGFAHAAQIALPALPNADLDWPSYAAGRTRGAPWFLCAARQVADAGHRVLLHGWNGNDPKMRAGLAGLGIGIATDPDHAASLLERDRIAYLPLETFHPALFRILKLREVLGLRSCINTVCRMLNPAAAPASVQGVFHPSYRLLQADAAELLGWEALSVIKGGGGEFERHPAKAISAFGLRGGVAWDDVLPALLPETRRLSEPLGETLGPRWATQSPDVFERAVVAGTAAAAFATLGARSASDQTSQTAA
ncbi:glycosyl transferase family protein [uncultured Roseovarius sp.]|uniref:glycosyl transferase family protein n=1 Tax=uncultured Roseovarius sp. TaxID=293344 RepID=UPI002630229E|nr:glycosyl transferase family protein [uncultured Roseovarius sp.]